MMIAQELVHFMHKKKRKVGFLIFKIDFEKTYDSVDLNFLRLILSDLGFLFTLLIWLWVVSFLLIWPWNGTVKNSIVSLLLGVFVNGTFCLLICSCSVRTSLPFLFNLKLKINNGFLLKFVRMVRLSLIFSLQMIAYFSPMQSLPRCPLSERFFILSS